MKLTSNNFDHNGSIPSELAFCRISSTDHVALSNNRNPHLIWSELPKETRSLVLICHDPDVPSQADDANQEGKEIPDDLPRIDFYHWLLANIPTSLNKIEEGTFSDGITAHGKPGTATETDMHEGINNYTDWFTGDAKMEGLYHGYDGPCPPWNDSIIHHYIFTLYALDIKKLELTEHFNGQELLKTMDGHVLDQASITGIYSLNPNLSI